tara:strand:- start:10170 stop:12149 length:1980 start_codon:yes stop_codon:yes gene_type:complete
MIVDTPEKYDIAIDSLMGHDALVIDVETNGLDPYGMNQICGVGISPAQSENSYYFPVLHQQGSNLDPACYRNLIEFLNESPSTFIGYNVKFDLHFLMQDGLKIVDQKLIDVIVMVRLTESSEVRDLDLTSTLKRRYGEQAAEYDIETKKYLMTNKWHKDFSLAPPNILGEYCKADVDWTRKLYWDTEQQITQSNQQQVWDLEVQLTSALLLMEKSGITIDNAYIRKAMEKIEKRQIIVAEKIFQVVGEFNINSTQQVGEMLNNEGIFSPIKTPKGKQSWGEEALVQINHPIAGNIRQYRTLRKLHTTYLEPYKELDEVHTSFCNWGALTGRLSSREPNLQNIPRNHFILADKMLDETGQEETRQKINAIIATKGGSATVKLSNEVLNTWSFIGDESYSEEDETQIAMRRMFKPRPNTHLVSFDYSQMEVRVFLSYFENTEIKDLLHKEDVDFHGEAAKLAFAVTESDKDFKFYRQMAKAITFGTIYGIGNKKLAVQLGTTPKEAGAYKKRYFAGLKGSKEFFDTVVKTVEERGWIKNRYGRVYKIPANFAYKGVNYLVQGTSADIMNERLIETHRYLKTQRSRVLLQVHDEIICEVHKDEIRTVPYEIQKILAENSLGIPLQVDMELCDPSWASKIDMEKALSNGHFPKTNLEEFIIWE